MCQTGAQSQASGHTGQISIGTRKSATSSQIGPGSGSARLAEQSSAPLLRELRSVSVSREAATLSSAGGSLQPELELSPSTGLGWRAGDRKGTAPDGSRNGFKLPASQARVLRAWSQLPVQAYFKPCRPVIISKFSSLGDCRFNGDKRRRHLLVSPPRVLLFGSVLADFLDPRRS